MKINLPVFKDEDAIWSLQGYPGELVRSSGMDITCDDALIILDEHYNNVKALNVLNQELFQLWMADKFTLSDWGIHLSRHLQVLAASFPDHFPPAWVTGLKRDHFYGRLPKCLKVMVAYLKAGLQDRTYSNYLRAASEVEKEDSMELSQSPQTQATDGTPKPWTTSFFPLQNFKGNQASPKAPTVQLAHLEEESTGRDDYEGSNYPNSIEGVTEEFMVHLVRAVKDAQTEEKCCYHFRAFYP